MGVTFSGRVFILLYALDRNEGFLVFFSGFKFLCDGVTFLGLSICIHMFSIGWKELLVAGCCALPCLAFDV